LSSVLRRVRFLMSVAAATAAIWSSCQAMSFQTKSAFPDAEGDFKPSLNQTITWPTTSEGYLVGGCGKGRISDPQTHGCRGPADLR
jgi:hypothetical protein